MKKTTITFHPLYLFTENNRKKTKKSHSEPTTKRLSFICFTHNEPTKKDCPLFALLKLKKPHKKIGKVFPKFVDMFFSGSHLARSIMLGRAVSGLFSGSINPVINHSDKPSAPSQNRYKDEKTQSYASSFSKEQHYSQNTSTAIEIKTKEGDVVTLYLSQSYQQSHIKKHEEFYEKGYQHQIQNHDNQGGFWQKEKLSYHQQYASNYIEQTKTSNQMNFSFSVDGHLNEDEQQAILELVKSIESITNAFLQGDLDVVLNSPSLINGSDTIASFDLNVSMEQSYQQITKYQEVEKIKTSHSDKKHQPQAFDALNQHAMDKIPNNTLDKFENPKNLIMQILSSALNQETDEIA